MTFNYAQRDTHMTISDTKVNRYYAALKQWHTLCLANTVDALVVKGIVHPEVLISHSTDSMFIMNNHRILFGNTAFVNGGKLNVEYYA